MNLRTVFRKNGVNGVRVFEQDPQCRTIYVQIDAGLPKMASYFLALPYIQFYFLESVQYVYMTFSNYPMEPGVKTYFPLLPNVYADSHICHTHGKHANYVGDPYDFIHQFWSSKFLLYQNHLGFTGWPGINWLKKTALVNYEGWSKETKKDPTFVLDFAWPYEFNVRLNGGKNLSELMSMAETELKEL